MSGRTAKTPSFSSKGVSRFYRTRGNRYFRGGGTRVVALNRVNLWPAPGGDLRPGGRKRQRQDHLRPADGAPGRARRGRITPQRRRHHPPQGQEALKEYRRRVQMVFQDPYQSLNPQHDHRRQRGRAPDNQQGGQTPGARGAGAQGGVNTAGLSPGRGLRLPLSPPA